MNRARVRPVIYNFTCLINSCNTISDLRRGREVHSLRISNGFRQMDYARKMFDKMSDKDLVAWNTVVSGYSQNGLALQVVDTVLRLQADGKMWEGLIQKVKDGGLDVVKDGGLDVMENVMICRCLRAC